MASSLLFQPGRRAPQAFPVLPIEEPLRAGGHRRREDERLGAGIKMYFDQVTVASLAKALIENIGSKVDLPKASFEGVKLAGKEIAALI